MAELLSDIAIQRELLGRSPADDVEVRVRIGIHSGYPTSKASNYIGVDVHTASRICAAGHGGQIVVSRNTTEAVKATPMGAVPQSPSYIIGAGDELRIFVWKNPDLSVARWNGHGELIEVARVVIVDRAP